MASTRRTENRKSNASRKEKRATEQAAARGHLVVETRTETVEEVVRGDVRHHGVSTSSVPVNRMLEDGEPAPLIRTEGDEVIVPILEEVLVVEKHLLLKEELHVHRTKNREKIEVPVKLRRQHAVIERSNAEEDGNPTSST
jgi:stress response protein YsnF